MILRPLILAAGLAGLAPVPLAALTAEELWQAATGAWARLGVTLSADLARTGAAVTLGQISGTYDLPLGGGQIRVQMGDIVMTESPDGSIAVALASAYGISLAWQMDAGGVMPPYVVPVTLDAPRLTITATGSADDILIATAAPQLDVTVEALVPDMPDTAMFLYLGVSDYANATRIHTRDGLVVVTQEGGAGRLIADLQYRDMGFKTVQVSRTDDLQWSGEQALPEFVPDLMNIGPALRAGLRVSASMTAGALQSDSVTRTDDTILSRDSAISATSLQTVTLGMGGLQVSAEARGNLLEMDLADLGMPPMRLPMEGLSFDLALPLLVLDAPQEARFAFEMTGIDPGPMLDALVAPGTAAVSTAPGNLALDLVAQVRPRQDLTDLEAFGKVAEQGGVVAEVNGVTLNRAQLDWAGASGLVSGWLAMDWTGVTRLEDLDQPDGAGTLRITGANDLLSRLSQAGVLPPEAMLGARAALSMAGRAVGADEIEGEFAVSAEGGFRLNGMRLD